MTSLVKWVYEKLKAYFTSPSGVVFLLLFAQYIGMVVFTKHWRFGGEKFLTNVHWWEPPSNLYYGYAFIALWLTCFIVAHLIMMDMKKERVVAIIAYYLVIALHFYLLLWAK